MALFILGNCASHVPDKLHCNVLLQLHHIIFLQLPHIITTTHGCGRLTQSPMPCVLVFVCDGTARLHQAPWEICTISNVGSLCSLADLGDSRFQTSFHVPHFSCSRPASARVGALITMISVQAWAIKQEFDIFCIENASSSTTRQINLPSWRIYSCSQDR